MAGSKRPTKMATIASTTSSSTSVRPLGGLDINTINLAREAPQWCLVTFAERLTHGRSANRKAKTSILYHP
jgi:hypothetical protein